ncbi:SpoIIE family protein phosphatase [Mycobacterium sp. MYCO198283]|uniref:PP2C family protein-serine/threonine phosphatase n=1 Tax=Mycobacterium sp. MYCO198283 TaxID=2883505 RepID=UPI001E56220E|nr:SpoIIE family protein phosphatase [Mycobacterium sp. MYCO198283]MCG5433271.1 SpoIIE family protein phosphatase [Mycobacterium sp. MYCO198283]
MVAKETASAATSATHDVAALGQVRAELAEEITAGLAGSLNLRRSALRLLTLVRPQLADWAMLVLPDSATGELLLAGGDDVTAARVLSRAAVAHSHLGRVLQTGRSELLHVALDMASADGLSSMVPDDALRRQAASLRPADVLGLGLTARGATFGALVLVRGQGRGFDDDEVAFAERVAARAAVPLDSARLYEERARIAAALAESLRPPSLPAIDGLRLAARYRPAAEHLEIGGDFYDVHGADDDWLFSLGDVCGKGAEVAALTGRTRQSIRMAAHFDRRPAPLLSAVNTVMHESGATPFVTVVCARVRSVADGGRADVELVAAGHPAPIVLRADGTVEQVAASGTAAGVLRQVSYRPAHVQLRRGDTLLMFTDGIDEARGADGFYGVERLLRLLPAYAGAAPDTVCEAVEQDVIEFLDGHPHDDMALLAVSCGT